MTNGPLLATIAARALDRSEAASPRDRARQLIERVSNRLERPVARPERKTGRAPARDMDAAIER
jgi:hypothetical protein